MKAWGWVAIGLVILGALEASGILALLPQCSLGFNFFIITGCAYPITIFGLNPNLVAGIVFIGVGAVLGAMLGLEDES